MGILHLVGFTLLLTSAFQLMFMNGQLLSSIAHAQIMLVPYGKQGPKGEPGKQGTQGIPGPPGKNGTNGKDTPVRKIEVTAVRGSSVIIEAGTARESVAKCKNYSELVTGGGYSITHGLGYVFYNGPEGNHSWVVRAANPNGSTGNLTAYAQCMRLY